MGFKGTKTEKKQHYDAKLCENLDQFTQVLVCHADNVGSKQLQGIRKGLRPDSVVMMGKNTMMKRSIRIHAEKTGNQAYLNLLPLLVVSTILLSSRFSSLIWRGQVFLF
jgi:large subunit ribosomal protein LP0